MYGDSKAITSDKECKKFECHETTVSTRDRQRVPILLSLVIVDTTATPVLYNVGQYIVFLLVV